MFSASLNKTFLSFLLVVVYIKSKYFKYSKTAITNMTVVTTTTTTTTVVAATTTTTVVAATIAAATNTNIATSIQHSSGSSNCCCCGSNSFRLGARCSSVVERPLIVSWVVGSIPHGGPSELFLVQPVLHCLWDGAY